jgi:hypothetical protein
MNSKTSPFEAVKTVLTITIGFIIVFFISDWEPALIIALLVGVGGIASTKVAHAIEFCWMKLAELLGYIVPNILMGIVFYLFLTPIAFLSRIFSHNDPLKMKNDYDTLFEKNKKEYNQEFFEKPW